MVDVDPGDLPNIPKIITHLDTEQWIALGITSGLTALLLGALVLVIWHFVFPTKNMIRWAAQRFPDVVFFKDNAKGLVALTIDDSPSSTLTPAILEVLDKHKCRASFFCIGEHIEQHPAMLQEIADRGHELCNHLGSDYPSVKLKSEEFTRQLLHVDQLIRPYRNSSQFKWFRPGHGFFNKRILGLAKDCGYMTALGSVYCHDPVIKSPYIISRFIKRRTTCGDIIVLHDGGESRRQTAHILEEVLPYLKGKGLEVVTLSELAAGSGWVPDGESIISGSSASKVVPQRHEGESSVGRYNLMHEIPLD